MIVAELFFFFLFEVGVIDFSMYLKNDIDDYRSEERYGLLMSLHFISFTWSRRPHKCDA